MIQNNPSPREFNFKVSQEELEIQYWATFLPTDEADRLFSELLDNAPWVQPELWMYGKRVKMPRLTAWYGDQRATYVYSGVRNEPYPWTGTLRALCRKVEVAAARPFNSVLLNLYRDGNDYMSWHRDDESELGTRPTIASVSLGASRRFDFRQLRKDVQKPKKYSLELEHGSLLVMSGETQMMWEHGISKAKSVTTPRINLTFRHVDQLR